MNRLIYAAPINTFPVSLNKLVAVSLIAATDLAFVLTAYALIVAIQN